MSVAYDLDVAAPLRQRTLSLVPALAPSAPAPRRSADPSAGVVAVLRPLSDPAPLRLTRRGVVALAAVLTALGAAVVVLAALSARPAGAPPATVGPAVVTVQAGDTLWSIASHAAPGTDPRVEMASIHRLNSLHGETLVPGERLRVR